MDTLRTRIRLVALLVLLLPCSATADGANGGVDPEVFERFLERYREDPGALATHRDEVQEMSPGQMRRIVEALDTTHFTYLYPMTIPGHEFPGLLGTDLDRLSLMAVRGGALRPVPFQFDEYDQEGLVWIEGVSRNDPLGEPGKLSDFDELVFMFRDGGREPFDPERHDEVEGELVGEIMLESPRNDPRFLYLLRDNPERSPVRYVDTDLASGRVASTVMEMDFDPRNLARIGYIASRVGPGHDENVFDNIHVEVSTGILNRHLRVSLDTENNIRAVPRGVRTGPVRNTVQLQARVWYFGLPTLFSHTFNIQFYEQGIVIPTQFAIDSLGALRYLVSMLREPQMKLSVDFRNLEDATTTFDAVYSDDERGLVDGYMSPFENRMNEARMPGDWLHLDSRRGWEMFFINRVPVTEGGLFDAYLEGTDINMVYRDDPDDTLPHQRFPGADPRLGFATHGLPQPALDLLRAMPRMPRRVETLGDAIFYMEERARTRNALADYDDAANAVLEQLVEQGRIRSVEELADAFIHDMGRMRFVGVEQDQLRALMRNAMLEAIEDPAEVRHGKVLTALVKLAEERDIDLTNLRYATMENALWFPDASGDGGPRDFHWQVHNPPRYRVSGAAEALASREEGNDSQH